MANDWDVPTGPKGPVGPLGQGGRPGLPGDWSPYHEDDKGRVWRLANLPAPVSYAWPIFGTAPDSPPLVPRGQWRDLIGNDTGPDFTYRPPVHNQKDVGCCNPSSICALGEMLRKFAGLPHIPLSAGDLYGRINWGRDGGSLLEDGMREAMANGIASADVVPYLDWQTRRPAAVQDRKRFRFLEAYICPTFDHVMSALLQGFGVIAGILWYQNYKPDNKGWLPLAPAGSHGGHALLTYKPTWRETSGGDIIYGTWHQNSWTEDFGIGGACASPEPAWDGPVGGWWAGRVIITESSDLPAPRVA